ncbi:hypothetical protein EBI_25491 [Enterocytozoon bieneusi H348]|nr:hypothetical protein EBI_25491 [Enterocytozoon bieneusi H348]|eukprot:XP_002652045.1 hypothetical protein EBI_25491 [Enterocytozoon bieneusi H348]
MLARIHTGIPGKGKIYFLSARSGSLPAAAPTARAMRRMRRSAWILALVPLLVAESQALLEPLPGHRRPGVFHTSSVCQLGKEPPHGLFFFFLFVRLASKPVEFYLSDFQASLQKKESHRTVWRDEAGGKCWACSGSCAQGLWQAWQSASGRGHGGTAVRRARDAWGMMSFRCSRRGTWRCPARVQGV